MFTSLGISSSVHALVFGLSYSREVFTSSPPHNSPCLSIFRSSMLVFLRFPLSLFLLLVAAISPDPPFAIIFFHNSVSLLRWFSFFGHCTAQSTLYELSRIWVFSVDVRWFAFLFAFLVSSFDSLLSPHFLLPAAILVLLLL